MSRCPASPKKKRHSMGRGHPSDYKHGMRGCSWKKTEYGRTCTRCGKQVWRISNEKEKFQEDKIRIG